MQEIELNWENKMQRDGYAKALKGEEFKGYNRICRDTKLLNTHQVISIFCVRLSI